MVIDLHAKNKLNICNCLGHKYGKLFVAEIQMSKASNFAKNQWSITKLKLDL